MAEKYIEVNEITGPYLASLKHADPEDLLILRKLLHEREWWEAFHEKSTDEKLTMLSFLKVRV